MHLERPPRVIETRVFTRLPEKFRRNGARTAWADANRGGQSADCFLEGPAFDAHGNLYLVDIPFGRIFRVSAAGAWTLVAEYEGWPNGLKIHRDGRILIADYMHGLMELDARDGTVRALLTTRNSEGFKGCNDLYIAASGDIYFTDQGRTGLHDPTGRVYRLGPNGRLDCLLSNGPSPNGLVLDARESVLFVAMTRDNSVWRVPLMRDGGVAKVGRFCALFGISGPDGLAMDDAGRVIMAHASLGHVFVFAPDGECVARVKSCAGTPAPMSRSAGRSGGSSTSHGIADGVGADRRSRRAGSCAATEGFPVAVRC
jgi:gluconolactonase